MALAGAMRVVAFFFFGELNRNGWQVPVPTPVEEPSCHTPRPLPPHGVFFFCVFFFLGFFVLSSALSFTAAAATAEGAALWTLGLVAGGVFQKQKKFHLHPNTLRC